MALTSVSLPVNTLLLLSFFRPALFVFVGHASGEKNSKRLFLFTLVFSKWVTFCIRVATGFPHLMRNTDVF